MENDNKRRKTEDISIENKYQSFDLINEIDTQYLEIQTPIETSLRKFCYQETSEDLKRLF